MHIYIFFFMQGFKSSNAFTFRMIMLFSEIEVKNSVSMILYYARHSWRKRRPSPLHCNIDSSNSICIMEIFDI